MLLGVGYQHQTVILLRNTGIFKLEYGNNTNIYLNCFVEYLNTIFFSPLLFSLSLILSFPCYFLFSSLLPSSVLSLFFFFLLLPDIKSHFTKSILSSSPNLPTQADSCPWESRLPLEQQRQHFRSESLVAGMYYMDTSPLSSSCSCLVDVPKTTKLVVWLKG